MQREGPGVAELRHFWPHLPPWRAVCAAFCRQRWKAAACQGVHVLVADDADGRSQFRSARPTFVPLSLPLCTMSVRAREGGR